MTAQQAPSARREVATGAGVLWVGMLFFALSTVVLLGTLSRHAGKNGFVGLSALLGLAFAGSVLPSGLHLRSAALVADGRGMPKAPLGAMTALGAAGVLIAPFSDRLLHIPPAAVIIVVIQVIVTVRLSIVRGAFLGTHDFGPLGVNLACEGLSRIVLGTILGVGFGITGLAAGMLLATVVAVAILRNPPKQALTTIRPTTSLLDTSMALALVGLLVQLDVLLAPSLLSTAAANKYDLAAVPAKGVYSALLAAGPLVFPFVRSQGRRRHTAPTSAARWLITQSAIATVGLGLIITVALALLRPFIAIALGKGEPSLGLLLVLGLAMSLAGGTAVVANAGVARGIARPWPPVALGMVVLVAAALVGPPATQFGIATAGVWVLTALGSLWISLYGAPKTIVEQSEYAEQPSLLERLARRMGLDSHGLHRVSRDRDWALHRVPQPEAGGE